MTAIQSGQLLVASQRLLDPNFARTVVLIVQHNDGGVIGLILNRPLDITVAEACDPAAEEAADVEDTLYQGGPCPGPLMVLHSNELAGGETVLTGVRYTTEREQIQSLMRDAAGPVRYFAGYSGWSQQQLEDEVASGAWLLTPGSSDEIFSEDCRAQWKKLAMRLTVGKWVDVERMPDDPTSN